MLLRNFIFLFILSACNTNNKAKKEHLESYVYPESVDTITYKELQRSMRGMFMQQISQFRKEFSKSIHNKQVVIHFEQFPINSDMIIPKRYYPDTKSEFVAPEYVSTLTCIKKTDTLFKLKIDKSLFAHLLDEDLKKYGVMYYEGYYNSLKFWEDSIVINYHVSVPATFIDKKVFLKTALNGKYRVFK